MIKTLFLVSLFGVLLAFLAWRRTPRRVAFETVFISTWVFAIAYWMTEVVINKFNPDLLDGFIPYLPPLVPMAIFVVWFLPRAKKLMA